MTCPRCLAGIAGDARFCTSCGAPVASVGDTGRAADVLTPAGPPASELLGLHPAGQARLLAPIPPWEREAAADATRSPSGAVQPAVPPSYGDLRPATGAASVHTAPPHALPLLTFSAVAPLRLLGGQLVTARGLAAWFLGFAALPFVLLQLTADDSDIKRAAWGFAVYFALMWAIAIHSLIRPERVDVWLLGRVVVAEAVGGTALAIFLERQLDPDLHHLGWAVFGVGLPEELAKAAPVVVFLLLRPRIWTTRMYMLVGAVSGLTFGVVEAVSYSSMYEAITQLAPGLTLTTQTIWRLLADGLFHGCCAGVSAYFIGLAAWRREQAWSLVLVGLAIPSVLHGVYDRWSNNWFGTATALAIVALFIGYVRAGDTIALAMAGGPLPGQPEKGVTA